MSVFKWETRRNFKSFLVWTVFMIAIQYMYNALFPSFGKEGDVFASKIQLLPKAFLKIFGIDKIDFTDILHFFVMQGQIWIFLFATFYVLRLSSGLLVKEENDKTIEFILARPISRRRYVLEKYATLTLYLLLYDLSLTFALYWMLDRFKTKPFDVGLFWAVALSFSGVHVSMATVGFLSSVFSRKKATADAASLFTLVSFYALALVSRVFEKYRYLAQFTPYGLFDPAELLKGAHFNTTAFVLTLLAYVSSGLFGMWYYEKKDIYA